MSRFTFFLCDCGRPATRKIGSGRCCDRCKALEFGAKSLRSDPVYSKAKRAKRRSKAKPAK